MKKVLSIVVLILLVSKVDAQVYSEVSKTASPNAGFNALLGGSVAIDGDYAVVGAVGVNSEIGTAFVYYHNGTTWVEQAQLTASDGAADDFFGTSVSISGNNIVIGAIGNNGNGSAYVYTKTGANWMSNTETAKLTASDGATDDRFGISVSISGDNIVVGADRDDDNGTNSGSAYVFSKSGTNWVTTTQTAKLTTTNSNASDEFGFSVAIYGDDIIIGAFGSNDNGGNSGSAYVYTKSGANWVTTTAQTAKLTASDAINSDEFGKSVAIYNDNIVVGAYLDDDNGFNTGSVYVFTRPGANWVTTTQTAKLTASDGIVNARFGLSVSIYDDKIVVGVEKDNDNGSNSGAVYMFEKTGSNWVTTTELVKLSASDGASVDKFGRSVAISNTHIVVGATGDDDNGSSSGSAYLFEGCRTYASISPIVCDDYTSPSSNYTWDISGNYTDTLTNSNGCDSIITIDLSVNNNTGTDVLTACDSLTWIDGITYTNSNSTATFTLTNVANCDSLVTLNLVINTVDVTVIDNSPLLMSNEINATYQWLDCDNGSTIIVGETDQTFNAITNGNYAVEVSKNNCKDTSLCVAVSNIGILENTFESSITISPNPTSSLLAIQLDGDFSEIYISVTNELGQQIINTQQYGTNHINIDLEKYPYGVYFIHISSDDDNVVLKVLKN